MLKNPDHRVRRIIIREWMALPRAKRQTQDQALAFAAEALKRHVLKRVGDPYARVMGWLLPRIGRT